MPLTIHLRGSKPFVANDVERALKRARVLFEPAQADEGAFWGRYPLRAEEVNSRIKDQKGQLWFRAGVDADGAIALSVSYSNAHVVRNVTDLVQRAPKIAEALGARAFVEEREIVEDDVDEITDEAGPLLTKIADGHRAALSTISAMPLGAIEVPTGRSGDFVDEYALFEALPADPVTLDQLAEGLSDGLGTTVVRAAAGLGVFYFGEPGVFVRERDPRRWQIRPMHGQSRWPNHARAISGVLGRFMVLGLGTASWLGEPLDRETHQGFQARMFGSALEFALYAREARPNARVVEA